MKFFRRIGDLWLHVGFLADSPQEPLQGLSAPQDVISGGKAFQVASPLIENHPNVCMVQMTDSAGGQASISQRTTSVTGRSLALSDR